MKFATRMERMQASEIRELLKLTAQPDIISFAGGLPAPELFPVEEIAKVSHDLVLKEGRQLLQYATTEGRPSLRAKIAKRMADKYHTNVDPDDILITTGSQQCLDFAGKLFLDPGDVVLCESPSYLGALNAFNAYQPKFVEVPTDNGGLIPEELADQFLNQLPQGAEVVMTGRNPPSKWLEQADYVTEVCARKHPYERGVQARKGVEY